MRSIDELRTIFSTSDDFNVIFDAFEEAMRAGVNDLELYRLLFWNNALTPDEVRLFGERLAKEFEEMAYDVFLWLASVFEVTYSAYDNFELALHYYRKAAEARPSEVEPYVNAADCYEPDLNIPPAEVLLSFLRSGLPVVANKKVVLMRLAYIYEMTGDDEQARYYRTLADDIERSRN